MATEAEFHWRARGRARLSCKQCSESFAELLQDSTVLIIVHGTTLKDRKSCFEDYAIWGNSYSRVQARKAEDPYRGLLVRSTPLGWFWSIEYECACDGVEAFTFNAPTRGE